MNDVGSQNLGLRVLVLAATPKDLALTRDILSQARVECCGCSSLDDLTESLSDGAGAILIPEEALVGTQTNRLARYLDEQPSWSDLPVMVLARPGADSAGVATAMDRYGNVTVLERPMRIAALVSAVRSALRARMRQYQVRDDAHALEEVRNQLEQRVRERTTELRQTNKILNETNLRLEEKMMETEAAECRAHVLLRELVTAQETERARIARDLHDELGQQVTSLRLHLSQIERDLSAESKLAAGAALDLTLREAEKIDTRVSFLAWKIRPTTIEEMGLAKALRGYVREWSRNFDVAADFRSSVPPRKRLLPEIETNVYRMAQESLNNIAKYADASSVDVLLAITEKELSLIVEDDGKGFDVDAAMEPFVGQVRSEGGLGIRGMQERAALLGGSVQIESTSDHGTAIYVRIPARFRSREKTTRA